jgi:hypothetical protein
MWWASGRGSLDGMQVLTARIGLAVPGRPIAPWSRRTGAPEASATGRDRRAAAPSATACQRTRVTDGDCHLRSGSPTVPLPGRSASPTASPAGIQRGHIRSQAIVGTTSGRPWPFHACLHDRPIRSGFGSRSPSSQSDPQAAACLTPNKTLGRSSFGRLDCDEIWMSTQSL